MDFQLTNTTTCDECGAVLPESTGACDGHDEEQVSEYVFRRVGDDQTATVRSTMRYAYEKLSEERDASRWMLLGSEQYVEARLESNYVDDIGDISPRVTPVWGLEGVDDE